MQLTSSQQQAVEHHSGNCKVISTAGSGKTTTLTERSKRIHAKGNSFQLCLTFTKAAAKHMQQKAAVPEGSGIYRTFHALCFNLLRQKTTLVADSSQLITQKDTWILDKWAENVGDVVGRLPKEVMSCFLSAQASGLLPEQWADSHEATVRGEDGHIAYLMHKKVRSNNRLTFNDLQIEALRYLQEDDEYRQRLQDHVTHILVDEFQDTDRLQVALLQQLYRGDNLFAVGDIDQAIYSWRGASPEILLNFATHFGEHDTIILGTNFRSQENIVKLADTLIRNETQRDGKDVIANRVASSEPEIKMFDQEGQECEWVVNDIERRLREGLDPQDIAILYRTNAYAGPFEAELVTKNIPFQNTDQSEGFFGMTEVKTLLQYMRLAINTSDMAALRYVWNRPNRFCNGKFLSEAVGNDCKTVFDVIDYIIRNPRTPSYIVPRMQQFKAAMSNICSASDLTPSRVLTLIRQALNYNQFLHEQSLRPSSRDYSEMVNSVDKLINTIATKSSTCVQFINQVDRAIEENKEKREVPNAVHLSTIHKAKGLEYPCVYVVGFSDNLMPHEKTTNLSEERRIAFVALTRAEDTLIITGTGKPSRFLDEMGIPSNHTSTVNPHV